MCVCVTVIYYIYNIYVPLTSEMMATPLVEYVLDKYKLIDWTFYLWHKMNKKLIQNIQWIIFMKWFK